VPAAGQSIRRVISPVATSPHAGIVSVQKICFTRSGHSCFQCEPVHRPCRTCHRARPQSLGGNWSILALSGLSRILFPIRLEAIAVGAIQATPSPLRWRSCSWWSAASSNEGDAPFRQCLPAVNDHFVPDLRLLRNSFAVPEPAHLREVSGDGVGLVEPLRPPRSSGLTNSLRVDSDVGNLLCPG